MSFCGLPLPDDRATVWPDEVFAIILVPARCDFVASTESCQPEHQYRYQYQYQYRYASLSPRTGGWSEVRARGFLCVAPAKSHPEVSLGYVYRHLLNFACLPPSLLPTARFLSFPVHCWSGQAPCCVCKRRDQLVSVLLSISVLLIVAKDRSKEVALPPMGVGDRLTITFLLFPSFLFCWA